MLVRGPGTDQPNGCFASWPVEGAAQFLTINGHHLGGEQFGQRADPAQEAGLELGRIETGKDAAKGVMGRDAVRQGQEGREPGQLPVAEGLNLNPVVCTTDNGTDGDHQDVQQLMALAAVNTRVSDPTKVLLN